MNANDSQTNEGLQGEVL